MALHSAPKLHEESLREVRRMFDNILHGRADPQRSKVPVWQRLGEAQQTIDLLRVQVDELASDLSKAMNKAATAAGEARKMKSEIAKLTEKIHGNRVKQGSGKAGASGRQANSPDKGSA